MNGIIQKHNWWIDAALFSAFLLTFFLDLTGLALHQWLGVAAGLLALYHLARHWSWTLAVGTRFLRGRFNRASGYLLIDAGLLAGFTAILVSGLLMSSWFNLAQAGAAGWRSLHVIASLLTLGLLVVKIGLHARWIVTTAREKVFALPQAAPTGAGNRGRRDFLKLMGAVGVVSVIALTRAAGSLAQDQAESTDETTAYAQTTTAGSSSAQVCAVRCGRRCSYPGHCRRYTDANNNGRCDLGECL